MQVPERGERQQNAVPQVGKGGGVLSHGPGKRCWEEGKRLARGGWREPMENDFGWRRRMRNR